MNCPTAPTQHPRNRSLLRAQAHNALSQSVIGFFCCTFITVAGSSIAHAAPHESRTSPINVPPQLMSQSRWPASTHNATKTDLINSLHEIQKRQQDVIVRIDEQIKKILQESTELSLKNRALTTAKAKLQRMTDSLEALHEKREDYILRREFIDQLVLAIDTKWNGQPLQEFLGNQLLDMAVAELSAVNRGPNISKFLVYMSVALREMPEPREDALAFIENYLDFAGIRSPKSPVDFLVNRSYTNGSISVSAQPADRKKLGDFVEKRLHELGLDRDTKKNRPTTEASAKSAATASSAQGPSPMQLRIKAPLAPTPSPDTDQNPNSALPKSSM